MRDAVISAIEGQSRNGDAGGIRDEQRGGDRSSVEETGGVRLHGGGHEDGAVVRVDIQRLADGNLLHVGTFANVDLVAGRGGVDRVLDVSERGVGTLDFVVIDYQPGTVCWQNRGRPNESRHEN